MSIVTEFSINDRLAYIMAKAPYPNLSFAEHCLPFLKQRKNEQLSLPNDTSIHQLYNNNIIAPVERLMFIDSPTELEYTVRCVYNTDILKDIVNNPEYCLSGVYTLRWVREMWVNYRLFTEKDKLRVRVFAANDETYFHTKCVYRCTTTSKKIERDDGEIVEEIVHDNELEFKPRLYHKFHAASIVSNISCPVTVSAAQEIALSRNDTVAEKIKQNYKKYYKGSLFFFNTVCDGVPLRFRIAFKDTGAKTHLDVEIENDVPFVVVELMYCIQEFYAWQLVTKKKMTTILFDSPEFLEFSEPRIPNINPKWVQCLLNATLERPTFDSVKFTANPHEGEIMTIINHHLHST